MLTWSKKVLFYSATAILLVAILLFTVFFVSSYGTTKPFYVGVTFGGDTCEEAKQLIDKVKDYTNLFVVQSDKLQRNLTELEKTCDYAVNSGLDVIVYSASYETQRNTTVVFIETAQERWGNHFLGVYYGDEPSGKALDGENLRLANVPDLGNVTIGKYGVTISQTNGAIRNSESFYLSEPFTGEISIFNENQASGNITMTNYLPNGTITVSKTCSGNSEYLTYFPNGTVTLLNGLSSTPIVVTDRGDISQFEPYQQLWDSRPFLTMDDLSIIAASYVEFQQATTDWIANQKNVNLFTSDYVLYWWDYQIGYDTVFAELGWNNTKTQEIGLVRGAANLQDKDWGTIITWTYTQPPYLTNGEDMYNQMRLSYECGASYVVVFNYAEDMSGPYDTLKEEHFQALQRFWNDVVQNNSVVHGGISAEAALVLPEDYGWGMRNPEDTIWGLWQPDETSQQIWTQLQSMLEQFGPKIDIIYDDPTHPATGKYDQIIFWNQTS